MIAIKNMKMPKNCISCPLYVGKTGEGYCAITHKWNATGGLNRLNDCPLIEIITCKDCKHRDLGTDICDIHEECMPLNHFCADGKRRE